jgi:hypothetical protein
MPIDVDTTDNTTTISCQEESNKTSNRAEVVLERRFHTQRLVYASSQIESVTATRILITTKPILEAPDLDLAKRNIILIARSRCDPQR